MRKQKIHKRLLVLVCMLSILVMLPAEVFAVEKVDLTKTVTLTVECAHEGQVLPGEEFTLYRVADTDESFRLSLTGDFKKYPVKLLGLQEED